MSIRELDDFYLRQQEPNRSCMMALRNIICDFHPGITQEWKYKLPFFYLNGKMFCYIWQDKKTKYPYVGFFDGYLLKHPLLFQGDRKRMKIFSIHPEEDIPITSLREVLQEALTIRT